MSDDALDSLLDNFNSLKLTGAASETPKVAHRRTVLGQLQIETENSHNTPSKASPEPQAPRHSPARLKENDSGLVTSTPSLDRVSSALNPPPDSPFARPCFIDDSPADATFTELGPVEVLPTDPFAQESVEVLPTDPFARIRELDEEERWTDRNTVITALEHAENSKLVGEILSQVIDTLDIGEQGSGGEVNTTEETHSGEGQDETSSAAVLLPSLPPVCLPDHSFNFDPLADSATGVTSPEAGTESSVNQESTEESSESSIPTSERQEQTDSTSTVAHTAAEADLVSLVEDLNVCSEKRPEEALVEPDNVPLSTTFSANPEEPATLNQTFDTQQEAAPGADCTHPLTREVTSESPAAIKREAEVKQEVVVTNEPSAEAEQKVLLDKTFDTSEDNSALNETFDKERSEVAVCDRTFDFTSESAGLNQTFEVGTSDAPVLNATFDLNNSVNEADGASLNKTVDLAASESYLNATSALGDTVVYAHEQTTIVENGAVLPDSNDCTLEQSKLNATFDATKDVNKQEPGELLEAEIKTEPHQPINARNSREQPIKTDSVIDQPIEVEKSEHIEPVGAENTCEQPLDEQLIQNSGNAMSDEEIPIPKGTYTINWDEIDEFADPFGMSKPPGAGKTLANSPPIRSNANPPRFSPEPAVADVPEPLVDVVAAGPAPDVAAGRAPDVTANPAAGDQQVAKKKSPVKKKKAPAKSKATSKFADYKKNQLAKAKGVEGDRPDLTISIPAAAASALDEGEPLPPPASYDFDNCADPFGSKAKVTMSPPIRAGGTANSAVDYDSMQDPFNTKSKVALSPVSTEPPAQFADQAKAPNSATETEAELPPPFNIDSVGDPFRSSNKMVNSPTTETDDPFKSSTKMSSSPPATSANQAPTSPNKPTTPTSPFMSSAELASASPSAIRDALTDSPAKDQYSTATTTSQDEEFEDAVDDLPEDEFRPAVPDMFDTTAALGFLDHAAKTKPSFKESALARQSLYRNFDPLVDSGEQSTSELALPEQSVCLMGDSPASDKQNEGSVDKLLDITMSSPASRQPHGRLQFTQDEMEEKELLINELKLDYEARILAKDQQLEAEKLRCHQMQQRLEVAEESAAQFERTVSALLDEKEQSSSVSQNMLNQVKAERDHLAEDLQQIETSFSDLHKRYDHLRETYNVVRRNEKALKEVEKQQLATLTESNQQYEALRADFQAKLEEAHAEKEQVRAAHHSELTKMEMAKRKAELTASSVQQQINQKIAENEELTQICDNLIQLKQAGHS